MKSSRKGLVKAPPQAQNPPGPAEGGESLVSSDSESREPPGGAYRLFKEAITFFLLSRFPSRGLYTGRGSLEDSSLLENARQTLTQNGMLLHAHIETNIATIQENIISVNTWRLSIQQSM